MFFPSFSSSPFFLFKFLIFHPHTSFFSFPFLMFPFLYLLVSFFLYFSSPSSVLFTLPFHFSPFFSSTSLISFHSPLFASFAYFSFPIVFICYLSFIHCFSLSFFLFFPLPNLASVFFPFSPSMSFLISSPYAFVAINNKDHILSLNCIYS